MHPFFHLSQIKRSICLIFTLIICYSGNEDQAHKKTPVFRIDSGGFPVYGGDCLPDRSKSPSDSGRHVLTIFAVNSLKPLDWESPASLVKSTTKGYKAKLLHHRQYLLGHMLVRLESPLAGGTKYSAMVSTSMKEKRKLMLKEKIGLGILGVAMGGKLDSEKDIQKDLRFFSRLDKITYVKYHISEESARRIIDFMTGFSLSEEGNLPPYSHYGGAFWPRYQDEGSGCSAYAMSVIDVAGLTDQEHADWKVEINIPMELVGGELNQGIQVPRRKMLKSHSWALEEDSLDKPYIPFSIFDPSLAYDWVMNCRLQPGRGYEKDAEGEIPGLVADRTHIKPDPTEPVFIQRVEPSPFVNLFERKRALSKVND